MRLHPAPPWIAFQYSHRQIMMGDSAATAQLARNRRLDEWFVRDLNAAPDGWALASSSVDAVLICVSVQVPRN